MPFGICRKYSSQNNGDNFEKLQDQYLLDVKAVVQIEEIPEELITNWDQTGIKYVPVDTWTMEKEGSKRVQVIGADDKRQIANSCLCRNYYRKFLQIYHVTTTRHFLSIKVGK